MPRMLFQRFFDVVRSAVQVVISSGYFMRLHPAVMRTWLGVGLFGTIVDHNEVICSCVVFWNVWDISGVHDEEQVCSLCTSSVITLR